MPNEPGRYRSGQTTQRRVNAPGSGNVRRGTAPGGLTGQQPTPRGARRPTVPPAAPPRPAREDGIPTGEDWIRPQDLPGAPAPRPAPQDPRRERAAARRRRAVRRARIRLAVAGTALGILAVSGIITVLLPAPAAVVPENTGDAAVALKAQLVAPLPYGGQGGTVGTVALDWGDVGPVRQTPGEDGAYRWTSLPAAAAAVQEFGRVDTAWFADAAFLGDSLTAGFCENEYNINVGGALICGYRSISPNSVVNRGALTNPDRGEEVPLDVLAQAQPKKLYILLGTNALVSTGNDEGFLNYYSRMLDDLRAVLPDTVFFVQSILPVRPEALENAPGLATDRLNTINAALCQLAAEKGCLFLDLAAEFSDEAGALRSDVAEADGVHLTVAGYNEWVSFLCTHVPYSKDNPYQTGSEYYLSDALKALLADLP